MFQNTRLTVLLAAVGAILCGTTHATPKAPFETVKEIPLFGNTYLTGASEKNPEITESGISGWSDPETVLSTYFYVGTSGPLDLALYGCTDCRSVLRVTVGAKRFKVVADNREEAPVYIGRVVVAEPGYVKMDMQGVSGEDFGRYRTLLLGGPAAGGEIVSVPPATEKDNWPYWGRRGPSVHMSYTKPDRQIRWFYNEVTVPEGNDILHCFYMCNGFNAGYMGMQVNSEDANLRRILFSVWSAYPTDDPREIPESYRIVTLRRGEGVHIGNFGDEGSGGQSYLHYPWRAGETYRFLTEVRPVDNETTIYTGYFCGHDGKWRLIASFQQPTPGKKALTYYSGMHSFLENYSPEMGYVSREACFDNQWVLTIDGEWIELCEGTFTCDSTGGNRIRLDYDGGVKEGRFFLRNCGFFVGGTPTQTRFTRPAKGIPPQIDFEALERIPSVE